MVADPLISFRDLSCENGKSAAEPRKNLEDDVLPTYQRGKISSTCATANCSGTSMGLGLVEEARRGV
jgi:hypothetical protein